MLLGSSVCWGGERGLYVYKHRKEGPESLTVLYQLLSMLEGPGFSSLLCLFPKRERHQHTCPGQGMERKRCQYVFILSKASTFCNLCLRKEGEASTLPGLVQASTNTDKTLHRTF